ncbi:MAG: WD40/YVTN/BNR-like repeat-containing protein [Kofleriaceae bacterium]
MIAISTAGVLETTDGGATWRGRNRGMLNDYLPDPAAEWGHDPHFITRSTAQPDHVWQQNHSGVFYSSDGAETWKKVSKPDQGVHFGFPVCVDGASGKTASLVPGRSDMNRAAIDGALFVARTDDGGESWRDLRTGLPQENAYDVVYRHALHNHDDLIAFGSTTGNLYVSEDRGERWTSVASNLPPIYSVRFG